MICLICASFASSNDIQQQQLLQISQNDGLPEKICKDCSEKAFLSFNFKATIEQSDATLRSVLFKEHSDVKKDAVFDENHTNYLMGIKTEIAFVDADRKCRL